MDRLCEMPALGKVDHEAGEFWVTNPFLMPKLGKNLSAYERNKLYHNLHGKSFLDVSYTSNVDIDSDSRSVIAADFTGDGAPDLLVASFGGGPLRLFHNRYPQQQRVRLDLIGVRSNRSALGTRVIAECGAQRIVRDVFAPNGFMGQGPPEILLGIGMAKQIDRLTVRWPTGVTQTFQNVRADSPITIREGDKQLRVTGR